MDKIFFIGIILLAILLAYIADKKDSKKILFFSILVLSLLSGFRGVSVGVDTKSYYYAFLNGFPNSWQFEETGFRIISNFLIAVFHSPRFLFVLYAFITNYLIINRLWDFRKKGSLSLMFILYTFIFYIETLNIMRQFLAISIIFYSTKLLDNKKYVCFFIVVLMMSFIHQSSLLALFILLVYLWDKLKLKHKILLFFPIILVSIVGVYFLTVIESQHIINYFSESNRINNFNFTFIYRFIIFLITYLICNGKFSSLKNNDKSVLKEFKKVSFIYFVGLIFSSMGMFYFVMARVGYFYLIFELLYWGYLAKNKKYKVIYLSLILTFAFYTFSIELLKNGSQIFPYIISLS